MACGGCGQARAAWGAAYRSGSVGGMARAVGMGVAVNWEKLRGTYSEAKYGGSAGQTPVIPAKPYQRPTERTK